MERSNSAAKALLLLALLATGQRASTTVATVSVSHQSDFKKAPLFHVDATYNDRAVSYIHQTPLRVSVTGRFAIDHCVGECPSLMDERPVYYVGIYGREWLD